MPIKIYKPTSPARRHSSVDAFLDITKAEPEKSLIVIKKKKAGRNVAGKITVRHRGGGAKKYLRLIDFKRDKWDQPAKVQAIEYDPNRGARIALVVYPDGEKSYNLAPDGLKVGDEIISSQKKIDVKIGNALPLEYIPIGFNIHNVELVPGKGGQLARGAGVVVMLMAVEGKYAQLKMPSGEIRLVPKKCLATIGQVSNPDRRLIRWGKAGRMRHRGIKPTVRGKAMNPVDHPHGGGEGSHPIGLKHPKTPWGKPALGFITRKLGKKSDKFILKRRPSKKR
jgi:large subunit ribosomal protein L2